NDAGVFANPCAICKVREAVRYCDYVIDYQPIIFYRDYKMFIEQKNFQYETCDLPMCKECANQLHPGIDFCPHHNDLHQKVKLPEKQRKYQLRTKAKILQEVWNS